MAFIGFEKHKLTNKERRIVIGVAIFMAIMFIAWFTAIVLMLPNPSHGLV